jgi:hypothetical protein
VGIGTRREVLECSGASGGAGLGGKGVAFGRRERVAAEAPPPAHCQVEIVS